MRTGMRIYVAAPSRSWRMVRPVMDSLQRRGYTIAHRWDRIAEGYYSGEGVSVPGRELAKDCVEGLRSSFCMVFCFYGEPSVGCWVELGMALAWSIPVAVVGTEPVPELPKYCWLELPSVTRLKSFEELVEWLAHKRDRWWLES